MVTVSRIVEFGRPGLDASDGLNAPRLAKASQACHCEGPERRGTGPGRCL